MKLHHSGVSYNYPKSGNDSDFQESLDDKLHLANHPNIAGSFGLLYTISLSGGSLMKTSMLPWKHHQKEQWTSGFRQCETLISSVSAERFCIT